MRTLLLFTSILFFTYSGFGQSAIKHSKQQTCFFYTQLNLHAGHVNEGKKGRFDLTNQAPDNQVVFQLFCKNQSLMQKGYIKTFNLVSYNIRLSVPYHKSIDNLGYNQANVQLKLLDTWMKFNTKWDRTHFWIGYRSIPYGHNPKLDPASSFMTNITKMDIGFAQDLGLFIKTPLANYLDVELSVTSGGFLNKPIAIYDQLINDNPLLDQQPRFSFSDYNYENTWLLTSRIGTPTFKRHEFGLILSTGNVKNIENRTEMARINRIGGDWIYKHYEKLKWSNQVVVGDNRIDGTAYTKSIHIQTALDYYLLDNFILSTSFAYTRFMNRDMNHNNKIRTSSLTYVFSPHTRLRLNQFMSHKASNDRKKWGVMLQFITGFGKRP
ncbi:MAG: hypothetical protein COB98_04855 [Flavobacteriaceae bacterium]|nr:MAG: hypothetical protein COB98_04855 [Flavobacteriaceae bacterium]